MIDLFWRNSGTEFVKDLVLVFRYDLKLEDKIDNDRYKLTTVKNSGRGRLLFDRFEKSNKEAFVISLSEQRRSSYIMISLFECLENSVWVVPALFKRLRIGQEFTTIKKRASKSTAALIFL